LKPERMNRSKPAKRPMRMSSPNRVLIFSVRRNSNSPATPRLSKACLSSSMWNLSPEVSRRRVKSSRKFAMRSQIAGWAARHPHVRIHFMSPRKNWFQGLAKLFRAIRKVNFHPSMFEREVDLWCTLRTPQGIFEQIAAGEDRCALTGWWTSGSPPRAAG